MSRFDRLVQINERLEDIAKITSKIAHSSASDADKDKQIAPYMKRHEELLEEAKKLFP